MKRLFILLLFFPLVALAPGFVEQKPKVKNSQIVNYLKSLDKAELEFKNLVKSFETFSPVPYKLGGDWLVGYGHLTFDSTTTITRKQADSLFEVDFRLNLSYFQNVQDVRYRYLLAGLSYNIGVSKVKQSKLYKLALQNCDFSTFASEYKRFIYFEGRPHKGLLRRREAELKVWENVPTELAK